ncbi:hydrolase [Kitasatospora sp. NBC_01250]|uniref:hydrolase n=1 Tax=Kitasatospora sp. NBC_01250 TaxID=2903571 RepID=UPI002E2EF669|nr:hydrolase [Kitasatospora sp. NBC_01250]
MSEIAFSPELTIDPSTALVLIDLQQGILGAPTVTPGPEILARGVRLADAFRAKGLPVVLVRVTFSADGGDLPPQRTLQATPRGGSWPANFAEFPAELTTGEHDIVITKRQWGAFTGTELDLQLRRRGVTQIVLAGIATSIGVESTARAAWEHGYHLTFVEDATTDMSAESHLHSFTRIFPRLGEIGSTDTVLTALGS